MDKELKAEKMPVVSVVMPAYNMERFIEAAVRSVMNQSFESWELLVIDDCSKDTTCTIVEKLALEDSRIRLIRNEENIGVAKTRDRGIGLCRGGYIAFLDSDDIWLPEKLSRQLDRIRQTGADFVYTSYSLIGADGKKVRADYLVPEQVNYQQQLKENHIGCSTVLIRAELAGKYQFNTGFYHEDYLLWMRLLQDGHRAAGCTEILTQWRYIDNSRSFNKYRAARNRWKIYREYLKLPLLKSIWLFGNYAFGGMRKYLK